MKKIIKKLGLFTILCMLMGALMGCEEQTSDTKITETNESIEIQTETIETEKETIEETKPYFENDQGASGVEIPEEIEMMKPLLLALCKNMVGERTYDGTDAMFFWESLYEAINLGASLHPDIRISDSGSGYFVPREVMSEFAEALFSKDDLLKDIPEGFSGAEKDDDQDGYIVYGSDGYKGNIRIQNIEETSTGYEISVSYTLRGGQTEEHIFELSNGNKGIFPCVIRGIIEE